MCIIHKAYITFVEVMFSLEKKRPKGDRIALFKYLKGSHTEDGQVLFLIIPELRVRNNGLKLQEVRFRLNIRRNFLLENSFILNWEVVSTPTLEAFKRKLDNHLSDLNSCSEQGVGLDDLIGLFQLHYLIQ